MTSDPHQPDADPAASDPPPDIPLDPQPPVPVAAAAALADWKNALRRDFERWLEGVAAIPEPEEREATDTPDLCSFYEQLVAVSAEARKANRRTAEAFSQWGETLARFDGDLRLLREQLNGLPQAGAKEDSLSRAHCLVLVELLDRMQRLAQAFDSPPAKSWWGRDAQWRRAWDQQRQAFDILSGHFDALLKQEGVTRLETVGRTFDPALMAAVATEPDSERPPYTVVEEIAAGYCRHGELLRAAQVKLTVNPH